jgi:hypothetical protein
MQLSSGRQNNRALKRSDDSLQSAEKFAAIPRPSSTHHFLQCGHKQEVCVLNKQLYSGRIDNRSALQMPLEDRTLLQMDQTTPANQSVLWNIRQRRQNTNLDRRQHLLNRSHYEKRAGFEAEFIRNPAKSQHYSFSERPYYASTDEN